MKVSNIDEYLKFISILRNVTFIWPRTRRQMPLAKALKRMGTEELKLRGSLACAVVVFGLFGAAPAWAECQSPSVDAGSTTTTVYPCREESATGGQQPIIVDTGKADSGNSSVVERGSADVPWFEPKPTTTADPIGLPKTASENEKKQEPVAPKEEIVKIDPVPVEPPERTEAEPTDAKAKITEQEATEAEPAPAKAKTTRKKVTKAKSTRTKVAKAKRTKVKLAKTKRTKAKVAQDKPTKTKTVKAVPAEPKPEPAKTEPAKSDGKVIIMTKKDMSLGSRVKNWFGF
jgi:hypothetical protein